MSAGVNPASAIPEEQSVAFFDVDGTVISGYSIASFVHYFKERSSERSLIDPLLEIERNLARYPSPRLRQEAVFGALSGHRWERIMTLGEEWFERAGRHQLIPATLAKVAEHRAAGDLLVLVSGSWLPCLAPIGAWLGVDAVFGSEPDLLDGTMTGEARVIMVEHTKVTTMSRFATDHGLELASCSAYADETSDLPMLEAVGRPVVVGANAGLGAVAAERGWPILPAPHE